MPESMVLIIFKTRSLLKLTFSECITSWSNDCNTDAVIGGGKTSFMNFKPLTFGCTGQFSTRRIFFFLILNFASHKWRIFSDNSEVIHPFSFFSYCTSNRLMFLKQLRCFDFPMTASFFFVLRVIFAVTNRVILFSLESFLPEHFSSLNLKVLSGISL